MKLSTIIGAEVFSLFDGQKVGTICSAIINYRTHRISGFKIFNDEDENEYFLPTKSIYKSFGDIYLIKNKQYCKQLIFENDSPILLNKKCINIETGEQTLINEMDIDENFKVIGITLSNNKLIEVNQIYKLNKHVCFFCEHGSFPKCVSFANRIKIAPEQNLDISLMTMPTVNSVPNKEMPIMPIRVSSISAEKALIGKIATKTVIGKNSELVVRRGELITKNVFDKAKLHNVVPMLY